MAVVRFNEGTPLDVLFDKVLVKLPSSQSPCGMTVMTVSVAPGGVVPPHSHSEAEEGYFVLAGTLTMMLGDVETELHRGDFAHVAAGVCHGYRNTGTAPVEFLAWTVGGQLDLFFADMHQHVQRMPEDMEKMQEVLARHDVQMRPPR